jgi:hypothetical protein
VVVAKFSPTFLDVSHPLGEGRYPTYGIRQNIIMNLNVHRSQSIGGEWFLCLLLKSGNLHLTL